jgi:hypothetical protein
MDEEGGIRVSNMLICRLGTLPMKYLRIPISDSKLDMDALFWMVEKVAKRVPS